MSSVPVAALTDEERSRRYRATIALLAQLVIALPADGVHPAEVKPEDAKQEEPEAEIQPAVLSNDQ